MVMAPIVRGRKGEFKKEMETLVKHGYTRARIDGELVNLDDDLASTSGRTTRLKW
jgi:excinuclease ABC subunit A